MFNNFKIFLLTAVFSVFLSQTALADSMSNDDMSFAFGDSALTSDFGEMALLSNQEMIETEGEWWPIVYGLAWGAARATIWTAGRFGSRWGYRSVTSSNNHRVLLHNGNHLLQTGGTRGVSGFGQNASHIGWGTSSAGNFSRSHIFYRCSWCIR